MNIDHEPSLGVSVHTFESSLSLSPSAGVDRFVNDEEEFIHSHSSFFFADLDQDSKGETFLLLTNGKGAEHA
jgi:hypothetical protein